MNEKWIADLRPVLRALYASQLRHPASWNDKSDHAYINNHLIERSIAGLAPRLRGEIIDVGCGQQPYRAYFAHTTRIVACDFDDKRGQVDFACPAHAIPVAAESFDAVFCTEVLEHVPDPLAVWREFHRILRPGGQVLLTAPSYWPAHELPYDFYRYPEYGLRYLATTAGFEVRELWPRGGRWALLGQVGMHVLGHYLKLRVLRRVWNDVFLSIDRKRNNPDITIGWTILAQKPAGISSREIST
ncbi:MAG: class I SAM-dependent methyltransferase [Verrucomicrobiota bacterium]